MDSSKAYELIATQTEFKYPDGLIQLFVGGSASHGAKLADKSDLDLYGVYVPPVMQVAGIFNEQADDYIWNTAGDQVRNGPDDIDLCLYSLRKWSGMAASGNPTALEFLFNNENLARKSKVWREFIIPNTRVFLSARAGLHFLKFSEHMLRALKGEGTGKRGQRLDLIGEFGYDAKAAMHLIRVLNEGIEMMETGRITLPRPEKDFLIGIRKGEAGSLADIEALAQERFFKLDEARLASSLPPDVSRKEISRVVTAAQMDVWNLDNDVVRVLAKAFEVAAYWISHMYQNPGKKVGMDWGDQNKVQRDILHLAAEFVKKEDGDAKKGS